MILTSFKILVAECRQTGTGHTAVWKNLQEHVGQRSADKTSGKGHNERREVLLLFAQNSYNWVLTFFYSVIECKSVLRVLQMSSKLAMLCLFVFLPYLATHGCDSCSESTESHCHGRVLRLGSSPRGGWSRHWGEELLQTSKIIIWVMSQLKDTRINSLKSKRLS